MYYFIIIINGLKKRFDHHFELFAVGIDSIYWDKNIPLIASI